VIPDLVEVWEEFESKGLVMLALSDEPASLVEDYVAKHKISYPTASGSRSSDKFKVKGIPAGFLIDHTGTIIWSGFPSGQAWVTLAEKALEKAKDAQPGWDPGERPDFLKRAVSFAKDGVLGKAWKETESLRKKCAEEPGKMEAIELFQTDFLARAATRMEALDEFYTRGVYFLAAEHLETQMKIFKGSPPEAEWKAMLKSWSKDPEIKALMALDKKRVQAMEMAWDGKVEKAQNALVKLRKKAKGLVIFAEIQSNLESVSMM
jgi:hypothetical protein